jgi:peptidoglycan/LPS O-acetylase OafA/YrhL
VFFTLSGFLISSILLLDESKNGRIKFKAFLIRRFLRLFPTIASFQVVILVLMFFEILPRNYPAVASSMLYVYNFVPHAWYIVELGHTWTLSIEEQFYFTWPIFMSIIRGISKRIIGLGILLALCFIAQAVILKPFLHNNNIRVLNDFCFAQRWFLPACVSIIIGCAGAILQFNFDKIISKWIMAKGFFLLIAAPLIVAPFFWHHNITTYNFAISLGVLALILWIAKNPKASFVKILEYPIFVFLGNISYSLYVYQGLFLRTGPGGALWVQQFPINVILAFLVAILVHLFIERSLFRYKLKYE